MSQDVIEPLRWKGENMTVANLNIDNKQFVVVSRKDFQRLRQESAQLHQLLKEDAALGKIADKALRAFKKGGSKGTPWEQVKRELGL